MELQPKEVTCDESRSTLESFDTTNINIAVKFLAMGAEL